MIWFSCCRKYYKHLLMEPPKASKKQYNLGTLPNLRRHPPSYEFGIKTEYVPNLSNALFLFWVWELRTWNRIDPWRGRPFGKIPKLYFTFPSTNYLLDNRQVCTHDLCAYNVLYCMIVWWAWLSFNLTSLYRLGKMQGEISDIKI